MFSISGYLKEWFDTAKYVIIQPRDFFKEMPASGSLKGPVNFMFFTIFIASLFSIPIIMFAFADYLSETDLSGIILMAAGVFVFSLFIMAISVPLNAFTYHFLLRICGANGDFKTTLRVFCYYLSASVVILPAFDIMMLIFYVAEKKGLAGGLFDLLSVILLVVLVILITYYAFYILFIGFSEAHRMSMKRVIFAIVGIPMAINIIFAAIPVAMIFISGFSTEASGQSTETTLPFDHKYTDTSPVESSITASCGSTPVVDGYYTSEDKWQETQEIDFTSENVEYTIAAKHDIENLYILIKWEGDPVWQNSMDIRFEQDGNSHDHNLSTGRDDYKYNGAEMYGPSNFADAHYSGGVREEENGMVAGNYSDGFWVQEWVVPLRSADPGDINIEQLPARLGFAVIDWGPGMATGRWPAGAWPYKPETWGNLEIVK
ncbi:MAG: YIP1 family protein [Methanosarcina sp.]|jgi:hypothetical protein